ncbi:putative nucleic acid-binding protein [Halopolyspora algeriensis]|uniref:Putative nucleic acid-binding protein n=1 Tax=Halopolyspora algeriensis TaxID=1500506 RepID=A0A368VHX3_9ACTN|nr:type II toxin-antitoxin system VapC family toxin [Halopolyspora algeriensis]RCW41016.1 putative nucleic acid-binding protein [Halopolyspora algeriensis]TQM53900.1 putative nucleic acid-binding protein [Halopolyspora algeriensis]
MITNAVIDASTLVDALLPGPGNDPVRDCLSELTEFSGPEHLRMEVLNVLRRMANNQPQPSPTLITARRTLVELNITLVPVTAMHERVWQLRHTLTAYDAAYAAAAEYLQVPLLTSDQALTKHPDLQCTIIDPRE